MSYTVEAHGNISEIAQQDWDRCANPYLTDKACGVAYDPFVSHAFLAALEESKSAVAETGWAPLKNHSQGEYVFDHNWADALERAGGRYYPKLQISIPFTPATGRRLLTPAGPQMEEIQQHLLSGVTQVAEQLNVSSVHITFSDESQWAQMGKAGFLQRTHSQFHWQNQGFETFDDFLAALSNKKRKNIRRERRDALPEGLEIEWVTGSDLREHHWDAFYQFYTDTSQRKWGRPYLSRAFFSIMGETMPDDVLLIMCKRDGRYIAGAINFIGSECLFGRNWGCVEDHRFLHFEVCYYQAIDFAIQHGLQRVEAGAQGSHKLARGYLPSYTYSAHWIVNPSFRSAVDRFLEDERDYVEQEVDFIEERHSPFRRVD
jgi:predicted N-acyltransferase